MRLDLASSRDRGTNNFDLLRLVAAVCVVFAHSFDLLRLPEPFPHIEGMGWGFVGVLIFFSISGFLVARSWDHAPRLLEFAIKRALRLLPGLIVALLLTALVLGPLVTTSSPRAYLDDPATKAYVINNAVMQSDYSLPGVFLGNVYPGAVNGSLWTLPLEVKAYFLVALLGVIGLIGRRRLGMLVVSVLAVLVCIGTTRSWLPAGDHFVATLVDVQASPSLVYEAKVGTYDVYADMLAAFVIGAALYSCRRYVSLRWDLAVLAATVLMAAVAVGGTVPLIAAVVVGPYLVLAVAYGTASAVRLPRRWGDYSYGCYIYAFPIQQALSGAVHVTNPWAMFAVAIPATFVAAVLSWHLVERPALRLKAKVRGAERPAGTAPASSDARLTVPA